MPPGRFFRHRLFVVVAALAALYLVAAYLALPDAWRHLEHQRSLANLDARTLTAQGIPGDVINVGIEGSEEDLMCALAAAGWTPADPVTLASSLRIVDSVVFRRPYLHAPVSPLYFHGRWQDFAFEKPSGPSPRTRHHVRFWKAPEPGDEGRPVWLGAAVFDDGLGVSHYTGQITHHTAPDIDAERDTLIGGLVDAKRVQRTYWLSGVGPTLLGHNGEGDPFFTDGEIAFAVLAPGCATRDAPPEAEPPPAPVAARSAVYRWLEALTRWLRL